MTPVEAFECLKEWALTYIKHRDMAIRKIAEIKGSDSGFVVVNNDGATADCIVKPSLKSFGLAAAAAKQKGPVIVFTLSNEENILAVYNSWPSLSSNSGLIVVFGNPFSAMEDKWFLKPFLHNKVCDRNSLLRGLKAMSELVEPVSEETLAAKSKR